LYHVAAARWYRREWNNRLAADSPKIKPIGDMTAGSKNSCRLSINLRLTPFKGNIKLSPFRESHNETAAGTVFFGFVHRLLEPA
jgi:hypothetical protein